MIMVPYMDALARRNSSIELHPRQSASAAHRSVCPQRVSCSSIGADFVGVDDLRFFGDHCDLLRIKPQQA
jgi:hypothetical protein